VTTMVKALADSGHVEHRPRQGDYQLLPFGQALSSSSVREDGPQCRWGRPQQRAR
jgi:hypothetical protein